MAAVEDNFESGDYLCAAIAKFFPVHLASSIASLSLNFTEKQSCYGQLPIHTSAFLNNWPAVSSLIKFQQPKQETILPLYWQLLSFCQPEKTPQNIIPWIFGNVSPDVHQRLLSDTQVRCPAYRPQVDDFFYPDPFSFSSLQTLS